MSIVFRIGFMISVILMVVGTWAASERWSGVVFRVGCVLFAMTYLAVEGVGNW